MNMERGSYSVDDLKVAVQKSVCFSDVCRMLNITICTFNIKRIKSICVEHNVSLEHFDLKQAFRRNKVTWNIEDVFVVASQISRSHLRDYCFRKGLYTGKCGECGIGEEWNGKPLLIELDHINGINDDNRVENLRWLCPNCHSQTPTYRKRHNRRSTE